MTASQFRNIDRWFLKLGEIASLFTIVLVFIILIDVILRYLFSTSAIWLTELEWHIFSIIFLFGTIYTLQYDDHVRVDVWYTSMSVRQQLWVNLLGTIFFLLPWCIVVINTSFHYALHSWEMNEVSADPGGLGYRYVIKFAITASFGLLFLYAFFFAAKCIARLSNPDIELFIQKQRD